LRESRRANWHNRRKPMRRAERQQPCSGPSIRGAGNGCPRPTLEGRDDIADGLADRSVLPHALWIGSIHGTCSGFSTGSISRLTTTASLSLRTSTHSSGSLGLALISWWGTNGGT